MDRWAGKLAAQRLARSNAQLAIPTQAHANPRLLPIQRSDGAPKAKIITQSGLVRLPNLSVYVEPVNVPVHIPGRIGFALTATIIGAVSRCINICRGTTRFCVYRESGG